MGASTTLISQGSTTHSNSQWTLGFSSGPSWSSFDQLKNAGASALSGIQPGCVGTVSTKSGIYTILNAADFQRLLGLATEINRLRTGVRLVLSSARFFRKHRDQESINLLIESAEMLAESSVLPERTGHDEFVISLKELEENNGEDLDLQNIPRPTLKK